ncbi:MAG: PD-(D/E)XK nuclease family protein [Desulfovermiculus sp.]
MQSMREIKDIIKSELPRMMETDPEIREFIFKITRDIYAGKQETESRFDRILNELQREREANDLKWREQAKRWEANDRKWLEQAKKWEANDRKWEENTKRWEANDRKWFEQAKKWEANDRKWEENTKRWNEQMAMWHEQEKKWEENQKEIRSLVKSVEALSRKHDSSIGALGARWGLYSEASFRNGLKAILEDTFEVKVERYQGYDQQGLVFGRPDQVELDVIIANGTVILCEIKSSIDKAGMYIFDRKKEFYEQKHGRKVDRAMVISPMIDDKALALAKDLGIETYSYADGVEL